jgi:VIT1/CCC1 family predicted Fe2+/Mn2+ transporter
MKESLKLGFSFGITSGVITTLGLIIGLDAGTHSVLAVLGGIITIAVADAFSDSLGMHISQETKDGHKDKDIWESMLSTFSAKFFIALSFVVPFLLLSLSNAIIVSIVWGLSLLSVLSYYIARVGKEKAWQVIAEHLVIAIVVIIIAHFVGDWISVTFAQ